MDSGTKRFLIKIAAVALAGWIAGNVVLGGPALSKDYMAGHRAEHDHYLEIIKSDAYKIYRERPNLVDLENEPVLKDRIAFVDTYAAQEDFVSEQHRLELRNLCFEFFNAALVVVLVLRLARKPLLQFLDNQIAAIQERLNQAARAQKAAAARLAAAREKEAHLHDEEMKVAAQTEHRLERELADMASASHYSLGQHERDLIERKKAAEHAAELAVRRAIVDSAIAELTVDLAQNGTDAQQERFVAQFIDRLEGAK